MSPSTSPCHGYTSRVTTVPENFDFDDEGGQIVVLAPEVGPEQLEAARQAVAVCPAQAISLADSSDA